LGIADHEESARAQSGLAPVLSRSIRGDTEEYLRLRRVGVLKLIDQNVTIALTQGLSDGIIPAHQVARALQQIIEVQQCGFTFVPPPLEQHFVEFNGERGDEGCRHSARDPTIGAVDIVEMLSKLVCKAR